MCITVKRIKRGKNSTLSEIYIDGKFFCYGLEDSVREIKIKGSTAIPAGTYKLGLNTYGGMNARYKRLYPDLHRGMIEIQDIPNFKYVYIHIGNDFSDTAGCLLVGQGFAYINKDYVLAESGECYKQLYRMLVEVVGNGDAVIEIT